MPIIEGMVGGRNRVGVLRVPLNGILPTYVLADILQVAEETYFGHLWLSLAEASEDPMPFPDLYSPKEGETLYVLRLEVGTPNFLELLGNVQYLIPVFGVFTAALGLMTARLTVQKLRLEKDIAQSAADRARFERDKAEYARDQAMYEREKAKVELDIKIIDRANAQEELRQLRMQADDDPRLEHTSRAPVRDISTDLREPAQRLLAQSKITDAAYRHKLEMQADIIERISSSAEYMGPPTLIVFEGDED